MIKKNFLIKTKTKTIKFENKNKVKNNKKLIFLL